MFPKKYLILIMLLLFTSSLFISSAQDAVVVNGYTVSFDGMVYDVAADTTIFSYTVSGTGIDPALSHFDIEIPTCDEPLQVIAYTPTDAVDFGVDPTTRINGIKWDLPLGVNESRSYTITFTGEIDAGTVLAAVKGGNGFVALPVIGSACPTSGLQVEKYVSSDGGATWDDGNSIPNVVIEDLTAEVYYQFVVTNTGTQTLTNIILNDPTVDTTACTVPESLEPDASINCVVGPFPIAEGLHVNILTVEAMQGETALSETARASYFGGELANLPVVIVITGPVIGILDNAIVIYDFTFELDDDDPLLDVIQLGDILQIYSASLALDGDFTIIIININFISIEIYVNDDGEFWRDSGNCSNAPPPWAKANGWRARCSGSSGGGSGSKSGSGSK